jgi:transcriptional regulator with XRE-family HTH domain
MRYTAAVKPEQRRQEQVRTMAEALKRKIREAGSSVREVEERAGMTRDYLRQVLRGSMKLRMEHVVAILEVIGVPPIEFFVEVYGPPRPAFLPDGPEHHTFGTTVRVMHRSLLRRLIWRLKERGIFTAEEAMHMLEELERDFRISEPPLFPEE